MAFNFGGGDELAFINELLHIIIFLDPFFSCYTTLEQWSYGVYGVALILCLAGNILSKASCNIRKTA